MREAKSAVPARRASRVTRIPTETIQPVRYRPPRQEEPRDDAASRAMAERFLRSHFSIIAAYAIQERCSLFPLTAHKFEKLGEHRRMASETNSPLRDALEAASNRLVDVQSCPHCMMRSECAFRQEGRDA